MGTTSSGPQSGRQTIERDAARRERSVSLVARLKERSESMESARGDYVVGTSHYVLKPNVRVEAYDTWRSNITGKPVFRWRPARIRKIRNDCALVAWDGYSERWDLWLPLREGKIRSPSHGPVVGPDGELYQPMWTPEPPPIDNDQIIVPVAAPLPIRRSRIVRQPYYVEEKVPVPIIEVISPPKQVRQSGLSRMRLSIFKKSSRSDEDDEDDEFSSAHDGDDSDERRIEVCTDIAIDEEKADDQIMDDEAAEGIETKEEMASPFPRIQRTVSTSSSMIVETGVPPRAATPPTLIRHLFRRSYQQTVDGQSGKKPETDDADERTEKENGKSDPGSKSVASSSRSSGSTTSPTGTASSKEAAASVSKVASPNSTRGQSGLVNLGNTCFMNAVLQSLSHVPPLVDRLLREVQPLLPEEDLGNPRRHRLTGRSDVLARALCALIRDQWNSNPEKFRRPVEMKKIISNIAPQFEGHRQHDAQELLVCLLDGLHECLNRINRRPTYVEIKPPKGLSDDELSYLYWDNYERGNDSFIKDLFCGQLMSRVTCLDCGLVSTSFDVFWDLSLPLPTTLPEQHQPNVQDLLKEFCEVETLTEDCGFRCEQCKRWPTNGATKQLSIAMRPKVLVLHLKRFSHEPNGMTKKLTTPVSFPLKNLILGEESYDMVSVVNHIGSFASGHYTADVYNPMTNTWFHADDANYTPTQRIGTNAYLLFYVESNKLERSVKLLCGT